MLGTQSEDRISLEEVRKYGGLRRRSVSTVSCKGWGTHPVAEMIRDQLGSVGNVDGEASTRW